MSIENRKEILVRLRRVDFYHFSLKSYCNNKERGRKEERCYNIERIKEKNYDGKSFCIFSRWI